MNCINIDTIRQYIDTLMIVFSDRCR